MRIALFLLASLLLLAAIEIVAKFFPRTIPRPCYGAR
jgi:hypothetical protein